MVSSVNGNEYLGSVLTPTLEFHASLQTTIIFLYRTMKCTIIVRKSSVKGAFRFFVDYGVQKLINKIQYLHKHRRRGNEVLMQLAINVEYEAICASIYVL